MITGIEIKNWRTHYNSKLEFEKGTNVIIGIMGSGKSSIVNAISYGLFGTFPSLKNRQISIKEIIMNKPNKQDFSEVKIFFEHNEKKYVVERKLKEEGTNEAKIFSENKLLAGPKQKDVTEKIEKILGLNYELFSRAVYAEQNEMDFFLKLSPGERKKKFDELLELEKYEIARKNSFSLKNQIIRDNKQTKEYLDREKKMLENSEEEIIKKSILDLNEELEKLTEEKQKINEKIKNSSEEYYKLEEKQKKQYQLKTELEITKSKIKRIQSELENYSKKKLSEIENEIIYIEQNIKETIKKRNLIQNDIEELNKKIKKIIEETSINTYKIKQIKKETDNISSIKGNCPTCKKTLDEEHKIKIITNLNNEKKIFENELTKNIKEKEELEKNYDGEKKIIDQISKDIENYQQKLNELNNEKKEIINFEKLTKELSENQKILDDKNKEIKENEFDENELIKKRNYFFETKNLEKLNQEKIISKNKIKENFEFTLSKIKKIKENVSIIENELKNNEKVANQIGIFENCLISTQIELREELLKTINLAMSDVWQQIYPYEDYIDVCLKVIDNGYDLQVQTRNKDWVRVEGVLSGGERSAAALCIRIAFSLVLTKQLSMIILDEPTHNLDSNAIEKLSKMLRQDLPKIVEQIFVITHEKELKNASTNKIYTLDRNKNLDEATKIEETTKITN